MNEQQDLLLRLGFSLAELGNQMQKRRDKIEELLAQGISPDAPEPVQLAKEYRLLQSQFASLEAQFQETKAGLFPNE
jgi:DNA-binding transcriptional MerR regulator